MKRIAIFVEGQTELIFVREFLLHWFYYQIDIECRTLFTDEKFERADYDFANPEANTHFQIINVGMDNNVLSRILRRERFLHAAGYETIIGLRDMYSEEYRKVVRGRFVDLDVNERFRRGVIQSIQQKAQWADQIKFCFAIMELEAWWIGIPALWKDVDPEFKLQNERCFSFPESVFHPATFIDELFQSQQSTYKKKKGEVESIVGRISREDYVELLDSQRCPSFCEFFQHLHLQ
jgi:hypothetical protein